MRVLIGCERSGIIREEFRKRGHDAWSCDLKESYIPGQHLKCDLLDIINDDWDLGIFHPDCKRLCFSGEQWIKKRGLQNERQAAYEFFLICMNARIKRVCTENSHSIFLNANYRPPDQIVHPWAAKIAGYYNKFLQALTLD